jgi:hypothetical protein
MSNWITVLLTAWLVGAVIFDIVVAGNDWYIKRIKESPCNRVVAALLWPYIVSVGVVLAVGYVTGQVALMVIESFDKGE